MQLSRSRMDEFAQTDVVTHHQWGRLAIKHPAASALMHVLIVLSNKQNAVVASQQVLADYIGISVRSVQRALKVLVDGRWIEVRQIGATASVNAYVINARVSWKAPRHMRGMAALTASVVLSAAEQPDHAELGHQPPLRQLDPAMFDGLGPVPLVDGAGIEGAQIDLEDWLAQNANTGA